MKSNIFIPKKIKIGFNPRNDTYTGRLGYVIYHDGKVWRKETSWKGWIYEYEDAAAIEIKKQEQYHQHIQNCKNQHATAVEHIKNRPNDSWYARVAALSLEDYLKETVSSYEKFQLQLGRMSNDPKMVPVEYDNVPTEGFVLNKKAGGTSSGWDHRQTYCRVYDPRGFEFEIVIPNLLYILENASSFKGKGLEGKFIYGWDGKDLVLIPEQAPEYKDMVEFTETLSLKISKKELVVGSIYQTAQGEKVTYLAEASEYDYHDTLTGRKVLWFHNVSANAYERFTTKPVAALKKCIGENPDFVNLLDKLEKETRFKPKNLKLYVYTPVTTYTSGRSSYNSDLFVLQGKTYKSTYLYEQQYPRPSTYHIRLSRNTNSESFANMEELIKKYPLFKRIIENEKVSK
jgi:hypothetical protein